jgi:hypothetical protein
MRGRLALVVGPPALFAVVSLLHPRPDWHRIVESIAPLGLAIDHPFPTGTIAMACLLPAGALWMRARVSPG